MTKITGRARRKKRIRKRVIGTSERPRLSVFKSHKNIYLQIIDDVSGKTMIGFGTNSKDFQDKYKTSGNVAQAKAFGELFAKKVAGKGITKVVFDRSGYKFHGRVKALAEGLRKSGLVF